jgi:hypothetical protein
VHGDTERCNIPVPSGACSTPAVCKPIDSVGRSYSGAGLQAAANDIADDDQFRERPQRHRHLRRQDSEPPLPVRHVGPLCRDAEVLVEPECRDRVSPHELVGLLGIQTGRRADLLCRRPRMRVGRIEMWAVGFEQQLINPDFVPVEKAFDIIEQECEHTLPT